MSSTCDLQAVSPVPFDDLLAFAGGRRTLRKAFILMGARGQSAGFVDADGFYAVAFLVPVGDSLELCISLAPRACTRTRGLVKLAQLTLRRLVETGQAVHAHVSPDNPSGQRLARMAGFVRVGGAEPTLWRYAGAGWVNSSKGFSAVGKAMRRVKQRRKAGRRSKSPTIGSSPA